MRPGADVVVPMEKPVIYQSSAMEQKEITFFRSSGIQQSVELHDFLEKLITGNPYNKYCLDCKKAKSTHFLVWLGIFTCKKCADAHLMNS